MTIPLVRALPARQPCPRRTTGEVVRSYSDGVERGCCAVLCRTGWRPTGAGARRATRKSAAGCGGEVADGRTATVTTSTRGRRYAVTPALIAATPSSAAGYSTFRRKTPLSPEKLGRA